MLIVAYSETLADRVRIVLGETAGVGERKMFGGLAFMINGHMCCGIVGDELMVRVGVAAYGASLEQPHAREMDFTGQPLRGMVYVGRKGISSDDQLHSWIQRGIDFVSSLPPK